MDWDEVEKLMETIVDVDERKEKLFVIEKWEDRRMKNVIVSLEDEFLV